MNNRDYKKFSSNSFYHIFNRSNGKQTIFLDKEDYSFFLFRLKESIYPETKKLNSKNNLDFRRKMLPTDSFDILCYCIMPNHYHFLIKQNTNLEISKLISKVCTSYSKYFNKKYKSTGSVFQSKFRSVLVETDEQLMWLSAYIHTNPSIANILEKDYLYPWSSYTDYLNMRDGILCKKNHILNFFKNDPTFLKKYTESAKISIKETKNQKIIRLD